jgi:DNA-binding NarL/FixJ family response regulator
VSRIKLLLVEQQVLLREGLVKLLGQHEDLEVTAVAAHSSEAVPRALATNPDVILFGVRSAGPDELEAIQRLSTLVSRAKIFVLSNVVDERFISEAIRAGVCGYLSTEEESTRLTDAIRQVYHGEVVLSPAVARELTSEFRRLARDFYRQPMLSERECEILQRIANGHTDREIANELSLAHQTVKNTLSSLFQRIGVSNRSHAVAWAISRGLINPFTQSE